jgi:hypothetical protein
LYLLTNRIDQMKIWINNWIKFDRSSTNYVFDKSEHSVVVEWNVCPNEMLFIALINIWESKITLLYLKLFPCFCFDCEKQKIVFELIINRIVERIELLVIVRLYCESENNIYFMRNKCLRVSTLCVPICVCGKFGKSVRRSRFCFRWNSHAGQDQPVDTLNRTARRSLAKDYIWAMADAVVMYHWTRESSKSLDANSASSRRSNVSWHDACLFDGSVERRWCAESLWSLVN